MSVGTAIPIEEYLRTSYHPDREYRDGAVTERNVGDYAHARLQILLGAFLVAHEDQWQIKAFTEWRMRVRESWCPIPDVCVYMSPAPRQRFPAVLPFLWIEILSEDDRMLDVWEKARELVDAGVPYVWIVDPNTLTSQLMTAAAGLHEVPGKTLQIPGTPIVIPLAEVMHE